MSLRSKIVANSIAAFLSDPARRISRSAREMRRRLRKEQHRVEVFLRHDNPYCLLLVRYLRDFSAAYQVELDVFFISDELPTSFRPLPELASNYARQDVAQIAPMLGETFADAPAYRFDTGVAAILALIADELDFDAAIDAIVPAMEAYWRDDETELAELVKRINPNRLEKARQIMRRNTDKLLKTGHYNSAMLFYGGEWYWGIDRLHYLVDRLDKLGIGRKAAAPARTRLREIMPKLNPQLPEQRRAPNTKAKVLEFFHSFRSPYSYIALERVYAIADRIGLTLRILPVVPMVRRGVSLPNAKRLYIVKDANREARRIGIAFGRAVDPLSATDACLRLFVVARAAGREREFCLLIGRAAWSEGVDLGDQQALEAVAERAGLAKAAIRVAHRDDTGIAEAAENRDRLTVTGLWGVPSFRCDDFSIWGQDRLGALIHYLR